jgi:transposase
LTFRKPRHRPPGLDWAVFDGQTIVLQTQSVNSPAAIRASLKAINADLDSADKQIKVLIQSDDRLRELFGLITSVPGVGDAIATEVLVATNEFTAINDPKKLACHAGVAPFEYRSGSSVGGKTRVSQHARLRLKSLFHRSGGPVRCHVRDPDERRATSLLPT